MCNSQREINAIIIITIIMIIITIVIRNILLGKWECLHTGSRDPITGLVLHRSRSNFVIIITMLIIIITVLIIIVMSNIIHISNAIKSRKLFY